MRERENVCLQGNIKIVIKQFGRKTETKLITKNNIAIKRNQAGF